MTTDNLDLKDNEKTILDYFRIGLKNNKFLKLFKSDLDPAHFGDGAYYIRYYYKDKDVFINEYFLPIEGAGYFEHYITFCRDGYEYPNLEFLYAKLGRN
jgi:hypothetical protein